MTLNVEKKGKMWKSGNVSRGKWNSGIENSEIAKRVLKSDPDWIRTNDLQLRRLPLYPAELRDRKNLGLQR